MWSGPIRCAPNQPTVMEDDYLAQELMMALVNIEEFSKMESRLAGSPDPTQKVPERVYSDKMLLKKTKSGLSKPSEAHIYDNLFGRRSF